MAVPVNHEYSTELPCSFLWASFTFLWASFESLVSLLWFSCEPPLVLLWVFFGLPMFRLWRVLYFTSLTYSLNLIRTFFQNLSASYLTHFEPFEPPLSLIGSKSNEILLIIFFFPSCASVALARSSHIVVLINELYRCNYNVPHWGVKSGVGTITYWGGPPLGVQILCTFPTPKTGMEQIEQFNMSPGVDFHPVKEY